MKAVFLAIFLITALAAGLAGPAAAASWGAPVFFYPEVQGHKGRPGPGADRAEPPRDFRRDRRGDERRERLNEDERQALHRDLDKANREIYRRRSQK